MVDLSIDDIERLLADAADRPVEVGDGSGRVLAHTHLAHALQVAALLRAEDPADEELAVAGLVHDIGHLLEGVGDDTHAEAGGAAVRGSLGDRVGGIVALHVEAKRYLVAQGGYDRQLSADSVTSLTRQGGSMTAPEMAEFVERPFAEDAVRLRVADDGGKVEGLDVGTLDEWLPVLRRVHARVT